MSAENVDYGKFNDLADPSTEAKSKGLLSGLFGGREDKPAPPPMSFEQAFFVILLGAAKSDGDIRREEEDQIRLITSRSPTFANMPGAQVAEHQLAATQWMFKYGVNDIVGAACDVIMKLDATPQTQVPGPKRAHSVFALATDIAFVDRAFDAKEEQFINALAKRLGVDDALRDNVLSVMRIKNAF